jgi:hypothetical protein
MKPRQYLSPADVAADKGCSVETVWRAIRDGAL